MFGADVVMSESASFIHGKLKDLLGFRGEFDAVGVKVGCASRDALNDFAYAFGGHAEVA